MYKILQTVYCLICPFSMQILKITKPYFRIAKHKTEAVKAIKIGLFLWQNFFEIFARQPTLVGMRGLE